MKQIPETEILSHIEVAPSRKYSRKTSSGMAPIGIIIPVSAHMINHRRDYDHILETYSKPVDAIYSLREKN